MRNHPTTYDKEKATQFYLNEMNVKGDEVVDSTQGTQLIQDHVVAFYKNRIRMNEGETITANEIAEQLADINIYFHTSYDAAWKKQFPNDIEHPDTWTDKDKRE